MSLSPNATNTLIDEKERVEGDEIDHEGADALALDISDAEIAAIIGRREERSVSFWNDELKLDEVRKRNENYWLNNHYDESELYDYQTPYKNNRIFTAVETLIAVVLSQKAEPTVMPDNDSDSSYELAQDLQGALLALYEDLYLKMKAAIVARHLLIGLRLGVMKYRFDPDSGEVMENGERKGAIVVEVIRPQRIVLGEGTTDADNIPLIFEHCTDTIENLVWKYPKKRDEIFKKFGIKRGTKSQLAKRVGYVECWFDYRNKQGKIINAVAHKIDDLVLGGMKNPNYNYEEWGTDAQGKKVRLNYFDRPKAPYILFSHLNLGKYVIDSTSLSEQAQPMQDILNKRGRQIVDNADQAQAGLVLNSNQIKQDEASKLTGDPGEKIMVDGDVRTAAARLPRNSMEAFVIRDKQDARQEIDNIFGANAAMRGEDTNSDTLGQDVMSQRANMGRIQVLADAMEDGFDRLYKGLTQMMKVYFDEDVDLSYEGNEGYAAFVTMHQAKIRPRFKVRVRAGSMVPKDKWAQRNETIQAIAVLDPLSIAEGLDKPNPKEFAKRLMYYRFAPDKYMEEFLGGGETGLDQTALADLQTIMQTKQMPVPPQDPSKEYVSTIQQFIQSGGFRTLEADVQQLVIQFAEVVMNAAKGALGDSQGATPEEAPQETPVAPEQTPEEATATPTAPPAPQPASTAPETKQPNIVQRVMGRIMGR